MKQIAPSISSSTRESSRFYLPVRKHRSGGFTIVELLIVIVVIAILATVAIVAYSGISQRARAASLMGDLVNASKQLAMDKELLGGSSYPTTTGTANNGNGLRASNGAAYQYTVSSSNGIPTYCLKATIGAMSYRITQDSAPTPGDCSVVCLLGYIAVPGSVTYGTSDFCVMKYEAKNVGGIATSQTASAPWVNISQPNALIAASAACAGCHLITEAEWLTIAQNVISIPSNWSGGSVGSGYIYSGNNDNTPGCCSGLVADTDDANGYSGTGESTPSNQRRTLTLTNGAVIWDLAGNLNEWTAGQIPGGTPITPGTPDGVYGWYEWSAMTVPGSLPVNPFPSYAIPAAAGWSSANGIGQVESATTMSSGPRGFRRGGERGAFSNGGIFTLDLNCMSFCTSGMTSFRVTQ